jgi:hypothetical protein
MREEIILQTTDADPNIKVCAICKSHCLEVDDSWRGIVMIKPHAAHINICPKHTLEEIFLQFGQGAGMLLFDEAYMEKKKRIRQRNFKEKIRDACAAFREGR